MTILPTQGVGWGAMGAVLDPANDVMVVGAGVTDFGEFVAASVKPNGSINTAFGGGLVATSVAKPAAAANWPYACAVQADGKLVSGGQYQYNSGIGFALVRYNTSGTLDTTFSGNGFVTTDFSFNAGIRAIALQGTNIVAAGSNIATGSLLVVARYTTKGKLDTTFGTAGTTTVTLPPPLGSRVVAIALQADGSIVVGLYLTAGAGGVDTMALVRFTPSGTLDKSFGTNGFFTLSIAGQSTWVLGIAVDANNKIVMAGSSNGDLALARVTPNGGLDATFGGVGFITETIGTMASSVAIQGNGAIVVDGIASNGNLLVARFQPNGTLDPTFGSSGGVFNGQGYSADFPYSPYQINNSLLLPSNGQIVAVGEGTGGGQVNAVIRYNSDGTPGPATAGMAVTASVQALKSKPTAQRQRPANGSAPPWSHPLAPPISALPSLIPPSATPTRARRLAITAHR